VAPRQGLRHNVGFLHSPYSVFCNFGEESVANNDFTGAFRLFGVRSESRATQQTLKPLSANPTNRMTIFGFVTDLLDVRCWL
jgi:hypothetical protein